MSDVELNPKEDRIARAWGSIGPSSIFQDPSYGELYGSTTRHRPLRFVLSEAGRILGYAQAILFREGPRGMGSLTTHATIRHGPIVAPEATDEDWAAFLGVIAQAFQSKAVYLRIYPGRVKVPGGPFAHQGFKREPWLDFYIDLKVTERTLLDHMSKERRYGIRKAAERGVTVSEADGLADVDQAYRLLSETHARARFPLEPRTFFREAFHRFHPQRLQIFTARIDGQALATSVIAIDGDTGVNWYAGSVSDRSTSRYYANDAVIWEAIRWCRSHGLTWFDMGGGGPPGDPHGFVKFKRQFGGMEIDVGHFTYVPQAWKLTLASRGFRLLRRIRRLER